MGAGKEVEGLTEIAQEGSTECIATEEGRYAV